MTFLQKNILFFFLIVGIISFSNILFPLAIKFLFGPQSYVRYLPPFIFCSSIGIFLFFSLKKSFDFNLSSLKKRLRLNSLKLKTFQIVKIFGFTIIVILIEGLLKILFSQFLFSFKVNIDFDSIMGVYPPSFWGVQIVTFGILLTVLFEELFWRGYLLPIQERYLGLLSWPVNGVMFSISHFLTFNPLQIIFSSLWISFIGFKYKNTSLTILVHLFINILFIIEYQITYFNSN